MKKILILSLSIFVCATARGAEEYEFMANDLITTAKDLCEINGGEFNKNNDCIVSTTTATNTTAQTKKEISEADTAKIVKFTSLCKDNGTVEFKEEVGWYGNALGGRMYTCWISDLANTAAEQATMDKLYAENDTGTMTKKIANKLTSKKDWKLFSTCDAMNKKIGGGANVSWGGRRNGDDPEERACAMMIKYTK